MGIDDIKDAECIRVLDGTFVPDSMTHAMIRDTSMGLLTGLITEVHSILGNPKIIAFILWFYLGWLSMHRFYVGY